jgi:alpha-tubulin suppressor-like RCC1 family protein
MPSFAAGSTVEHNTIVQVACGQEHTAAVTDYGLVQVTGSNQHQKLGIPNKTILDTQSKFTPVELLSHKRIVKVVCAFFHTMALSDDG